MKYEILKNGSAPWSWLVSLSLSSMLCFSSIMLYKSCSSHHLTFWMSS